MKMSTEEAEQVNQEEKPLPPKSTDDDAPPELDDEKAKSIVTDALSSSEPNNDVTETSTEGPQQAAGIGWGQKFKNFRQRMAEQRQQAKDNSNNDSSQATAETSSSSAEALQPQELRPALISVSVVVKETDDTSNIQDLWGLELKQLMEEQVQEVKVLDEESNEKEPTTMSGAIVPSGIEIAAIAEGGLLYGTNLQAGDKLVTINNRKCIEIDQVLEQLSSLTEGTVFFVAETPVGNPRLVQATVRKPAPDSLVGVEFINEVKQGTQLLLINSVSSQGLLSHSVLNQGQLVLTINNTFCGKMDQQTAADLIKTTGDIVTITAMKPGSNEDVDDANLTRAQRMLRSAKRAGVAVGGGVMVGVGLVFIPTLPPPFGEVLIVGGVSVLGTEFEAPKRFMRNTRDSLARAVGPAEEEEDGNESERPAGIPEEEGGVTEGYETNLNTTAGDDEKVLVSKSSTVSEDSTASTKSRKTMKTRFKNFGRNVVLPFLDQVVGDKPHGENHTNVDQGEVNPEVSTDEKQTEEGAAPSEASTELSAKDAASSEQDGNEQLEADLSDKSTEVDIKS